MCSVVVVFVEEKKNVLRAGFEPATNGLCSWTSTYCTLAPVLLALGKGGQSTQSFALPTELSKGGCVKRKIFTVLLLKVSNPTAATAVQILVFVGYL